VNIARILAELKAERSRLDRAIAALEKLAFAAQKKRKRAARSTRRSKTGTTPSSKDQRGKVILFRKLRKSGNSKGSQAEEA
jgi:hypothetical protein